MKSLEAVEYHLDEVWRPKVEKRYTLAELTRLLEQYCDDTNNQPDSVHALSFLAWIKKEVYD